MLTEYIKHLVIRTPVEPAAHWLRHQFSLPTRMRHPELSELYEESQVLDQARKRLMRADSSCIDIGAHLGSQLSNFVSLAPRGRHIAIEPVPYKAKWLRQKFPEVEIHEVALSDQPGEVSFFIDTARTGYSSLNASANGGQNVQKITVAQTLLDDLVGDTRQVDFMKVDVEGWELFVLRGAKRLLRRCRPAFVFESTADGHKASGATAPDTFDFLAAQEYQVHTARDFMARAPALTREEFCAAHVYPFRGFNFLATPRIPKSS